MVSSPAVLLPKVVVASSPASPRVPPRRGSRPPDDGGVAGRNALPEGIVPATAESALSRVAKSPASFEPGCLNKPGRPGAVRLVAVSGPVCRPARAGRRQAIPRPGVGSRRQRCIGRTIRRTEQCGQNLRRNCGSQSRRGCFAAASMVPAGSGIDAGERVSRDGNRRGAETTLAGTGPHLSANTRDRASAHPDGLQ